MVALTQNANRTEKEGQLISFKVKGGVNIFRNALVAVDATGYLVPMSDTAGLTFAGMAYEGCDASNAVDGELSVRVERENAFEVDGTGFVQADVLKAVVGLDDNSVGLTSTNSVSVGRILEVISGTRVLVEPVKQSK